MELDPAELGVELIALLETCKEADDWTAYYARLEELVTLVCAECGCPRLCTEEEFIDG